jgi:hypothetical protein
MDLISPQERTEWSAAFSNMHDTFAQDIKLINRTKTPKEGLTDNDDDYDFTQDHNAGNQEFEVSHSEQIIKARVKYLDRQDKDYQMINQQVSNVSINSGLIRIKVRKEDCDAVSNADNIIVDGINANITFSDRRHGLVSTEFCTFYLERTP